MNSTTTLRVVPGRTARRRCPARSRCRPGLDDVPARVQALTEHLGLVGESPAAGSALSALRARLAGQPQEAAGRGWGWACRAPPGAHMVPCRVVGPAASSATRAGSPAKDRRPDGHARAGPQEDRSPREPPRRRRGPAPWGEMPRCSSRLVEMSTTLCAGSPSSGGPAARAGDWWGTARSMSSTPSPASARTSSPPRPWRRGRACRSADRSCGSGCRTGWCRVIGVPAGARAPGFGEVAPAGKVRMPKANTPRRRRLPPRPPRRPPSPISTALSGSDRSRPAERARQRHEHPLGRAPASQAAAVCGPA